MKKALIFLTAFLLLAFNLTALAQDEEDYERDVVEVNLYGGLNVPSGELADWNDTLGAKTGFSIGFDVGYFVTDKFIAGFNFSFSQFSIDNEPNDTAAEGLKHRLYSPNLYLKYYFSSESNWAPYVKGQVGLDNPKFTTFVSNPQGNRYRQISYDPAVTFSLGLGLFYYTSDYSGLFLEGNYHFAAASDIEATYQGTPYVFGDNLTTVDIHAGVRILIGSGE